MIQRDIVTKIKVTGRIVRALWPEKNSILGIVVEPHSPGDDYAESWEIVDRGADQSVVACGPLAGTTLGDLARQHGPALMGQHHGHGSFPLIFKFLDARKTLSVQVHPDDQAAARLDPPDIDRPPVLQARP